MKVLLIDLKLFLLLTLICGVILITGKIGILEFPLKLIQTLTIPIQYGFYKTGQNTLSQFNFIFLARSSFQENVALKKQLSEVINDKALLSKKLKETEELVDQYNKLNPETYDLLPARVISSVRYLTLDKGLSDGLKGNESVVYKDNYIGKIQNVSPKISQVLLVTDPESKIAVFSQGESGRSKGIIQGQFGSELLMDKILHQEVIEKNDIVYSEGTEGLLPKGLIIGRVTEVLERQNEVFKQAKVEPVFNAVDLDNVFIIKNP
jgi:rod shape-determining protein MreC